MSLWSKMRSGLSKVPRSKQSTEPLSLSLLLESSRLFPGQILRGTCRLTSDKPTRLRDITVFVQGFETTHFQQQVSHNSDAHCRHAESNLDQSIPLMQDGVCLASKNEEPLSFNFELPISAAPSFKGRDFEQSYHVMVRVTKFSGDEATTQMPFTVCTQAPEEEIPASVEQGDSHLKLRAKITSIHLNLDSTLGYNALCRSQLLEWGTVELLSISEFKACVCRCETKSPESLDDPVPANQNSAETIVMDVTDVDDTIGDQVFPVQRVQRFILTDSLGAGSPTSDLERLDVLQRPLPSGLLPTFEGKHVRHDTWIEFTLRAQGGETVSVRQRLHLYTGANLDGEPEEVTESSPTAADSLHPNLYTD